MHPIPLGRFEWTPCQWTTAASKASTNLMLNNVDEWLQIANLNDEHIAALAASGELDDASADRMIENVIGTMSLPVGVATNFIIDEKHYVVPFCLEESSVVAAASNMAKRCHAKGGFSSNNDAPMMIAQIQLLDVDDHDAAIQQIEKNKIQLMELANSLPST